MLLKDVGEDFVCKAPRTIEHLAIYCFVVLDFKLPYPKYCETHNSPLEALWSVYSEKNSFDIWLAMRGSGKTLLLSILGFLESVFKENCTTTILGASFEQSSKCIAYLDMIWNLDVLEGLRKKLLIGDVTSRGYQLSNGSSVTALTASQKSVRGPHPVKLRLDEVDCMDRKLYESSLGQPKSKHGLKSNIIVSSTLHEPFGLMGEVVDNRHKMKAKLYRWCINEVLEPRGFWTKEEYSTKVRICTKATIDAEYLLKRPKIGSTIFDWESVDRSYARGVNFNWKTAKGKKDQYNKLYTELGIDWGYICTALSFIQFGRDNFNNFKTKTYEYIELTDRCNSIADLCEEWNVYTIYCDSSPKDSNITLSKTLKKRDLQTNVVTIAFNKWKSIGINVIRFLLEKNLLNITDHEAQKKIKAYHYKNLNSMEIDKIDDHIPDSLISWGASKSELLKMSIK